MRESPPPMLRIALETGSYPPWSSHPDFPQIRSCERLCLVHILRVCVCVACFASSTEWPWCQTPSLPVSQGCCALEYSCACALERFLASVLTDLARAGDWTAGAFPAPVTHSPPAGQPLLMGTGWCWASKTFHPVMVLLYCKVNCPRVTQH